jgi:hypothetical protein
MKPTAFAALAALVAVARMSAAQTTGSPDPAADTGVRATTEARALVATMQHNARIAFDALASARVHRRRDEVRCADEALSRADVALRRAREDSATLEDAVALREEQAVRATLERLHQRAAASHEAEVLALSCSPSDVVMARDQTIVTVHVDPLIAHFDP